MDYATNRGSLSVMLQVDLPIRMWTGRATWIS